MGNNQMNSPKVFSHKGQGKSKHFQAQMQRIFAAFYKQPKTMLMVSIESSILRANICRNERNILLFAFEEAKFIDVITPEKECKYHNKRRVKFENVCNLHYLLRNCINPECV